MKPGETIYAQRSIGGYMRTFFGRLVRVERGVVVICGRWIDRCDEKETDMEESFRANRCYLWGKDTSSEAFSGRWARCHWFRHGAKERAQ